MPNRAWTTSCCINTELCFRAHYSEVKEEQERHCFPNVTPFGFSNWGSQRQILFVEPGNDVEEEATHYMAVWYHIILRLMFLTMGNSELSILKVLASNLCYGYPPLISEPSPISSLISSLFLKDTQTWIRIHYFGPCWISDIWRTMNRNK